VIVITIDCDLTLAHSSAWVFSPMLLWEKAHPTLAKALMRFATLHVRILNLLLLNYLQRL